MRRSNNNGPSRIRLNEDRKRAILRALEAFYAETFDEKLSTFRTVQILEFFLKNLGPPVYNQGVQDARAFMLTKLDDIDGEVYEVETPIRPVDPDRS